MAKRKNADEQEITDEEKKQAIDDAFALIDETWADVNGNVKEMFKGIALYIHGILLRQRNLRKQLEDHVAELSLHQTLTTAEFSDRLDRLEMHQPKFIGTWSEGLEAKPNCSCTHDGSLWVARETTSKRPGSPNSGWILCAKKGRDGKDAAK